MEWITNVELAVLCGILLNLYFSLERRKEPEHPPSAPEYTILTPPKPVETRVTVLKGNNFYARLNPDHPDLQEYRDTPGFFLVHPDGSVEPGVQ